MGVMGLGMYQTTHCDGRHSGFVGRACALPLPRGPPGCAPQRCPLCWVLQRPTDRADSVPGCSAYCSMGAAVVSSSTTNSACCCCIGTIRSETTRYVEETNWLVETILINLRLLVPHETHVCWYVQSCTYVATRLLCVREKVQGSCVTRVVYQPKLLVVLTRPKSCVKDPFVAALIQSLVRAIGVAIGIPVGVPVGIAIGLLGGGRHGKARHWKRLGKRFGLTTNLRHTRVGLQCTGMVHVLHKHGRQHPRTSQRP